MDGATKTTRELAVLLLDYERGDEQGTPELTMAVQSAFEKLNVHLSRRLGSAGYRALLTRALALAAQDAPWLAAIQVTKEGALDGFAEAAFSRTLSDSIEGGVAMIASFVGLLDTFVGRNLSMRLLSNVWPEAIQIDHKNSKDNSNG